MGWRCGVRRERSAAKSEVEGPIVWRGLRDSSLMVARRPKSVGEERRSLNWETSSSEAAVLPC